MTGQTIEHSVSIHWQIIESKICIYQLSANYDSVCIYTVILLLWNQSGECQIRCEVWVPPQKENTNSSKYISWDMHHPPACCVFNPICVFFVVYSYFIFAVFVFQMYSYCIFAVFVFVVYLLYLVEFVATGKCKMYEPACRKSGLTNHLSSQRRMAHFSLRFLLYLYNFVLYISCVTNHQSREE